MTTTTAGNGRAERKTLASQLDRLDGILDALSDGLHQAVASTVEQAVTQAVRQAVGQAVHEAVQAVLTEVLTNRDLRAVLRDTVSDSQEPAAPQAAATRPVGQRLGSAVRAGLQRLADSCGKGLGQLRLLGRAAWQLLQSYWRPLLLSCGVGVAACLVAYGSGPWLSMAAGWLGGLAGTLTLQMRQRLQRLLPAASSLD